MQCKEVESVLSLAGIWRYPGGKGRAVEVAGSLRPLSGSREGERLVLNSLSVFIHLGTADHGILPSTYRRDLPSQVRNTLIDTPKGVFPL